MLRLVGVRKNFGAATVLQRCDITVERGQTTVLIGPSGCGKSTLLRLMMGLLPTDEGEIFFQGTPLTPQNAKQLRHQMGYVIQDGGLFPHLTAEENATLMARYLKWDVARVEARVRELADLTKLPLASLKRFPIELSGGQRQRVGLIRALMLDPVLLLLDEPMGALDPMIRSDLQQDLKQIFQSLGKTVVLVTHDLAEASFLGDTIFLMRGGVILQRGRFRDLIDFPQDDFVSAFIQAQRSPTLSLGAGAC